MVTERREQLQAEIDKDKVRAEELAAMLMRMDPEVREVALRSRLWHYRLSTRREHKQIADQYAYAGGDGAPPSDLTLAIEMDLYHRRNEQEESENLAKLERRVENLEAMLGQVLNRLTDIEAEMKPHLNTVPPRPLGQT